MLVIQKLGNFALVYISKMPAVSSGNIVKIGTTSIILNSSCRIAVGSRDIQYNCFLRIVNGEVTIENISGANIENLFFKGFAVLT